MTKTTWITSLVGVLFITGVVGLSIKMGNQASSSPATSTPVVIKTVENLPYGKVTLKSGQTAIFARSSVKLLRVSDDSRCAKGMQCIWAGTIKAEIQIVSGMGTSTNTIEIGKSMTTEVEKISFILATPYPKVGVTIKAADYAITFDVSLLSGTSSISSEACYVGGCSGEVCSDQEGVASNCIYKSEFACYKKTSTCEKQATGKCGWRPTEALAICLNTATSAQ